MKNLSKSKLLTSVESINRTLKKKKGEKIILKISVQSVPGTVKL
jgi:hypothetical protein